MAEVLTAENEDGGDGGDQHEDHEGLFGADDISEDEFGGQDEIPIGKVFLAVKQAIARLHANSGHRSNRRLGKDEMEIALGEATSAYNCDVNESGVSSAQAAVGRQPRMTGDVLSGVQCRLAEHGLVDGKNSLARQVAMRETAKVAMTRLHFSRGLRKAELARSRSSTLEAVPEPGSICYFFRPQKYNSKTAASKKRLSLRLWHGPALLLAVEGHSNAYLSFKGQLTKCALGHVRKASTMEQIAASTWRDAIEDVVEAAVHDMTRRGMDPVQSGRRSGRFGGENAPQREDVGGGTSSSPMAPLPQAAPYKIFLRLVLVMWLHLCKQQLRRNYLYGKSGLPLCPRVPQAIL